MTENNEIDQFWIASRDSAPVSHDCLQDIHRSLPEHPYYAENLTPELATQSLRQLLREISQHGYEQFCAPINAVC